MKKSIYLDETVNEAVETLAVKYKVSFSHIINELLIRALVHIDDVEEELKQDLIHKLHVEKRKRFMRVKGFKTAMKKEIKKVIRSQWSERDIKEFLQLWREEAEALNILEVYKDAIRELKVEMNEEGVVCLAIEEEFDTFLRGDIYGSD